MTQLHIFISGMVQGVGFRQFVKREARRRGVVGWVKNLPDNRVEAVLQGEKKQLEEMLQLCRRGPFLAKVKNIDVCWEDAEELFVDFQVVREY